uniref:Uncharacterized protein n=2 Tax=Salix viminalis TaxID=40686 RepID=A0A6N2K1Q1_SALVM
MSFFRSTDNYGHRTFLYADKLRAASGAPVIWNETHELGQYILAHKNKGGEGGKSRTAGTITSMMTTRIMRTPSYQPVPGPSSLIPKPRDSAADTMRRKMGVLLLDLMSSSKRFLAAGAGVLFSALALRRLRSSPSPAIPFSKSVPSASAIPRTPPNACKESSSLPFTILEIFSCFSLMVSLVAFPSLPWTSRET